MSTHSSSSNLVPPSSNPESIIRNQRRNLDDPSLLLDFEEINMANMNHNNVQGPPPAGPPQNHNGPPGLNFQNPAPDLQTMEKLCQPTMNGRGGPIAPVNIQATNFGLKNHMIQQSMKQNGVIDDALCLYLFPYSLTHHATAWFDRLPKTSIHTFQEMSSKFLSKYFPPSMVTKLRNDISNFRQLPDESLFEAWERYKLSIDRCLNHNMLPVTQIHAFYNGLTVRHRDTINVAAGGTFIKRSESSSSTTSSSFEIAAFTQQMTQMRKDILQMYRSNQQVNFVTPSCETCGGPHSYYECQAAGGYTQDVYATTGSYNSGGNAYQPQGNCNLLSYRSNNFIGPPGFNPPNNQNFEIKILTKVFHERPQGGLPSNTISNPQEDIKVITTRNESTTRVPPPVVQPSIASRSFELPLSPFTSSVIPERNPHQPLIPYPSRLHKEKLQDKSDIQIHSFLQMFKKLNFNIIFPEALAYMPKYAKMVKDLLTNKEKLLELVNTPLNENCLAVLLKKLPEKLRDTGRFLIPCEFQELESCMALADLGASINLMHLSVWEKLILLELTPTRMTLELATRTVAYPAGIDKDVLVKVGKFIFPTDFVVVNYDVDPRFPLILGRPFLRMARALVDVHREELTLRVSDEKLVFNVESTLKYPRKHGDESIHMIDILDNTCEDYFHEVINVQKSIHPLSGSPTPSSNPVVESLSPPLIPFGDSDFLLEETDKNYLMTILHLISLPLFLCLRLMKRKRLRTSIEDPPDLELNDLPPHLEYVFLEGTSKLPVIIAKDLKWEEKEQLLKVLKSHKWAIAWKISDIQGIDPNFCTHKILMEDDFKLDFQHQRRVNPKIHEVIKEEVIKFLDAGLIYPISDSPLVIPIHVVPKKGGMTVITNEDNELIPTRLVMGWRICIDYRKLNDATRKGHFLLLFMDQMLERLVGNESYCFLDGFSGYFQILIDPQDQEKTTFTCPYGTFAYRRMPFGLCNAPGTFRRCLVAIFHDMIEKTIEVFMDDFSVFGDSFSSCLSHLDIMLKSGIEVDQAKLDVIAKLTPPTTVKGIRSFLGHVSFYRRFIQDFSKIAWPMTHLLEKDTPFFFSSECQSSFEILKKKLCCGCRKGLL
ncbi:reverse transcriptase domain-containing protein [Tanacetum coccineum]|uniref:Reverse transcriptase domain-containing protein n=1 Tax=Tanacetum coccineum TaxID=301880 RepID=A0ABQ5H2J4_9ASTR